MFVRAHLRISHRLANDLFPLRRPFVKFSIRPHMSNAKGIGKGIPVERILPNLDDTSVEVFPEWRSSAGQLLVTLPSSAEPAERLLEHVPGRLVLIGSFPFSIYCFSLPSTQLLLKSWLMCMAHVSCSRSLTCHLVCPYHVRWHFHWRCQ